MRRVTYRRAWMYPAQEAALFAPERYAIIEASTKVGKTVGALIWLLEKAITGKKGQNYWWVAPTYFQSKIAFRRMKNYLPRDAYKSNDTELRVDLLNGTHIYFLTTQNPDHLYGEDVYALVIDEATRVSHDAWFALRSVLTATNGPVRLIGNVKGTKNWAYDLARKAEDGVPNWHYAKITAWDAVEGGILSREEIEDAKRTLPREVFEELYEAKPSMRERYFNTLNQETHIINREDIPDDCRVVRAWDFAATEVKPGKDPDWTAGVRLGQYDGKTYIIDVVRIRAAPNAVLDMFVETSIRDNCDQVVEQEPGSAGKFLVEQLKSKLRGAGLRNSIHTVLPSGDKATRAYIYSARWNDGDVYVASAHWTEDFIREMEYFPTGTHDDMVDASAHAFNHIDIRNYGPSRIKVPGQDWRSL